MTLNNVTVTGSRTYGIRNNQNLVSFNNLYILANGGYGIGNVAPTGLVVGIGGHISGTGTGPISNVGAINFQDVFADNFLAPSGTISGRFDQITGLASAPRWKLPVPAPPVPKAVPFNQWVNIRSFGAVPDPTLDSTAAFLAAFASNSSAIYIPTGIYKVTQCIPVGDSIQQVDGM